MTSEDIANDILEAEAQLAEWDESSPEQMKRVHAFNGGDSTTLDYWRKELAYWQEIKRDAVLNVEPDSIARANKAITLCTKHMGGMIRGHRT